MSFNHEIRHVAPIKRKYPGEEYWHEHNANIARAENNWQAKQNERFAAPSEAPIGLYFPEPTPSEQQYNDIKASIDKHIAGAAEREKAALEKANLTSVRE